MQDNIKITFYEPWMDSQIIELFCRQYGNSTEQFTQFFSDFYNHPYQKNESIRLVAVSDKTVAGFASFCKWPYVVAGKKVRSFQCGNVIISEDFRGKGLYNRMLNYLNGQHEQLNIDLIIGFPIREIVKLYLKSGWANPFNLSWYVKPVNVFSLLVPLNKKRMESLFSTTPAHSINNPGSKTELEKTEEFYKWHKAYNAIFDYYYFKVEKGTEFAEFALKLNIRKKVIKELIIGEVITNSNDAAFVTDAFKQLRKRAFKTGFVTILSVAINDLNKDSVVLKAIQNLGYKKIEKDIKFIYKNFTADEAVVSKPENWILYRRDLDTW
jgi:hypothetical protein